METHMMNGSPRMEAVIRQLATVHGVDLTQQGATLSLEMPTRSDRWIITNLDGARISVSRCVVEEGNCLGLELDMVFTIHMEGWEPVELVHSTALWEEYRQTAKASGIPVYQENGDTCFPSFTEYWARQIEAQGWLTQAYQVADPEAECMQANGRFPGCQSTHAGPCYGELWQCEGCGKTVCFAEGSDNHPELCDACWVKQYGDQKEVDDVPF
jgi:hypothetical protein